MTRRAAAWTAWSICVLSIALGLAGLLLLAHNYPDLRLILANLYTGNGLLALTFPVVGALIVSRQPHNLIGWIFCAQGPSHGLAVFSSQYGYYALVTLPGSLPAPEWIAPFGWTWAPGFGLLTTFLFLLFPNGRLLSSRWRAIAWLSAGWMIALTLVHAVRPGPLSELPALDNPFGIEGAEHLLDLSILPLVAVVVFTMAASVLSLVIRYRRAQPMQRQQIKWFTCSAVILVPAFLISDLLRNLAEAPGDRAVLPAEVLEPLAGAMLLLTWPWLPIILGISILRYRLYDIDLIIRRTLVYGALTAGLGFTYWGLVVLMQQILRPFTEGSELAIIGSTLAVAALFQPARRRIQDLVDRRFYRRKYDAQKTLEAFSARLREQTDLDSLGRDLVGVVEQTVQPAKVWLWLRPPSSGTRPDGSTRSGRVETHAP